MLGIGAGELVLILIFGFVIFGPDKLPAMAKTIGQAIAKFRRAQAEMSNLVKSEVYDPAASDPFKNPLDTLARLDKKVQAQERKEDPAAEQARRERQLEAQRRNEERKAQLAAKRAQARASMAADGSAAASVDGQHSAQDAADANAGKLAFSADELYGIKADQAVSSESSAAEGCESSRKGE